MPAPVAIIPLLECAARFSAHPILTSGTCRRMPEIPCRRFTDSGSIPPFGENPIYPNHGLRAQVGAACLALLRGVPPGQRIIHLSGIGALDTSIDEEIALLTEALRIVSIGGVTLDGIYLDTEFGGRADWIAYQAYAARFAAMPGAPKPVVWCMARVKTTFAPAFPGVAISHYAYPQMGEDDVAKAEAEIRAGQALGAVVVHTNASAPLDYAARLWAMLKRVLRPGVDAMILFPDGEDHTKAQNHPDNDDGPVHARAVQRLNDLIPILQAGGH